MRVRNTSPVIALQLRMTAILGEFLLMDPPIIVHQIHYNCVCFLIADVLLLVILSAPTFSAVSSPCWYTYMYMFPCLSNVILPSS